ncbi:lytic transglycosylase domain-containing protein [Peptostreptococcus sp. D1]|uniref:lytic transglycosylase domain-containing protein n=1 Tax=Peptostreptococcus sp. D1 TaxID=72304 RepID=UPI0008F3E8A9|nr:lytic transglycosylase domain-containing protein [Peptostreptococcus sp. D1]SFE14568.1 soluble lytic murein transglycosylase [Peptostreptococcus sp. D1]
MKKKRARIVCIFVLVSIISIFMSNKQISKVFYPTKYKKIVEYYSNLYDIDKYLIYSIIKTESSFDPNAVSTKEAKGLMQVTNITADWINEELRIKDMNIFDPDINIRIGTRYLKKLENQFNGNLTLMIAAYNGGSGNVRKWLKEPQYSSDGVNLENIPFKETSDYTKKVLKNYELYKKIYQ